MIACWPAAACDVELAVVEVSSVSGLFHKVLVEGEVFFHFVR